MAIDYPALRVEIDTDPTGLGLVALRDAGNSQGIADALNAPQAGITVRRARIRPAEVLEAVDDRDFVAAPNAGHAAWFGSLTQPQAEIRLVNADGTDTRTLGTLRRLFQNPGPQGTRDRLTAVADKAPASRAEQLFGEGTVVRHGDVSQALALE